MRGDSTPLAGAVCHLSRASSYFQSDCSAILASNYHPPHTSQSLNMATLNIQWPSATFPQSTKTLLANFFALVESKDPDSGEHIAHEIFTPDGVTKSGAMVYKGTKGPSSSPPKSRRFDHIEITRSGIAELIILPYLQSSSPPAPQPGTI
jgi:hypothetical protein